MLHPDTHRDLVRERHSELLRQARAGELAQRLGTARRDERRSFLARLLLTRPYQAPASASSA
jgi:hypothetical protein